MSNDKTLADVQPGGRVRLGDGVRCNKCKDRGYVDVDVDVDDSGSSIGNIEACPHCALSAQPSPGGNEGDSDLLAGLRAAEEYLYYGDCNQVHTATIRAAFNAIAARQPVGEPVELACVAETIANGAGIWMTCSGCHESNDGAPTGPYSTIMQCHLGHGCDECGGIGAIWDTTDYQQMADEMAKSLAAPPAQAVDLGQFRDLIGFAALAAISLPETDPRRDFIRQANELAKLIDDQAAGND